MGMKHRVSCTFISMGVQAELSQAATWEKMACLLGWAEMQPSDAQTLLHRNIRIKHGFQILTRDFDVRRKHFAKALACTTSLSLMPG